MRTISTVEDLRAALRSDRREGLTIGLVPTMGALHEGHLSLIERAREQCDRVVVSLFVNPAQFDEGADLERYPRREAHDARLAAQTGADLLFAPAVEEVYPDGFATSVEVLGVSERLEGAARGASHFRGVCTVVTKLLCMCQPDAAYFGQKDAQQVVVIRRLVRDLNLPVRIEVCPTVREPDGLAMSSRNTLLDPRERDQALALYAALRSIEDYAARGERRAARLLEAGHQRLTARGIRPEYLELVDPETLECLEWLDRPALLAVAANVGAARLIDNLLLQPVPSPAPDAGGATEPTREAQGDQLDQNRANPDPRDTDPAVPTSPTAPSKETATCSA
jgi:pantoate--beta-alanine ligase